LSERRVLVEPIQLVIGGKTLETARHREIFNLSTGEVVGLMPLADGADLDRAVGAASAAFTTWKNIADSERADPFGTGRPELADPVTLASATATLRQLMPVEELEGVKARRLAQGKL
jgi:acyl-CoA reductase-like NAD-dependent aldehyde dehydrogenase